MPDLALPPEKCRTLLDLEYRSRAQCSMSLLAPRAGRRDAFSKLASCFGRSYRRADLASERKHSCGTTPRLERR